MNVTEQKVAKKLKTLKTSEKSIRRMAEELKNVQSPELRERLLDFILFRSSTLPMSRRISLFLKSEPGNAALIDDAFLERFLGFLDERKEHSWAWREHVVSLYRFMELAGDKLSEEHADRVAVSIGDAFRRGFVTPGTGGEYLRGILVLIGPSLSKISEEKQVEYTRLVVDAVLSQFAAVDWGSLEPSEDWTGVSYGKWSESALRDLMFSLTMLINSFGDNSDWDKVTDVITKSRNPGLIFASLLGWRWGNEEQVERVIRAAFDLSGEDEDKESNPYTEYLYPELYAGAASRAPRMARECLDKTINYALENNVTRGLVLISRYLLDKHDPARVNHYKVLDMDCGMSPANCSQTLSGEREAEDLGRVLDGIVKVLENTKDMTGEEWAKNAIEGGRRGSYGRRTTNLDPRMTPNSTLLDIASQLTRYIYHSNNMIRKIEREGSLPAGGEVPGEGSGIVAEESRILSITPMLRCACLSMEKIFNALIDSLDGSENSYPREWFSESGPFNNFVRVFFNEETAFAIKYILGRAGPEEDLDKLTFFTDAGKDKFAARIKQTADPYICGNALNSMAEGNQRRSRAAEKAHPEERLLLLREADRVRDRAEGVITVLVEKLAQNQREGGLISSPLFGSHVGQGGAEEFAPFFAQELSKLNAPLARGVFSQLFASTSGAYEMGSLLFSGKLSGGALEFLKEDSYRSLNTMINNFLGYGEKTPWWFKEGDFMNACVEFTDRPRNFSLRNATATERFLEGVVSFLRENPDDAWATELSMTFLSLCGRGVLRSTRESMERKGDLKSVAQVEPKQTEIKGEEQSLIALEKALGERLRDLETGQGASEQTGVEAELGPVMF